MPYPNEHACRIREPGEFQEGSFRRIKEGKLSIIIGRLKGKTSTTTQAFRYPTDSWTASEAKKHCQDHDGRFEAASQGSLNFSYLRPFKHEIQQGKLITEIDVIEPGVNLNQWGVTDAARRRAADTLRRAVLLGPPDEDHLGTVSGGPPGAPHEGMWYPIQGHFNATYSNGVTGGKAIIQDPYAEEKIKSGEWAAVSPSVHGLARYDDQGNVIFDDFTFQHVLFLPKEIQPAYPHVGIRDFEEQGSFEVALQAALRPFTVKEPQGSETDADMKALGIHPENKSKGGISPMYSTSNISPEMIMELRELIQGQAAQIKELQDTMKTIVEAQSTKTQDAPKSPDLKIAELEAKTKALETFQGVVSKREHDSLVASVLEAEKQAGQLTDDKAAEEEKKRLDTFSNETLNELHTVHSKTAAFIKSLPPAKKPEEFDEKAQAALDDVWNTVHRQMFGHAHDKDGKEVP